MKIHPVGADLFHADRQTDRYDEANSLRKGLKLKKTKNKCKSRTKHIQRETKQLNETANLI